MAGRGSSGGFAPGDGWGSPDKPGIPRSVAVFFDTYRNPAENDPSDNYVAVCTNGPIGKMKWPPHRLGVSRKLKIRLKDGKVHEARIRYTPPLLFVYLDDGEPVLRVPVDLRTVTDEAGNVFAGFTASTGNGYEAHEILATAFKPAIDSSISVVESSISFLKTNCLEGRNLCTPPQPAVEERGPGSYHIVLPADLPDGAEIPNPTGRPIEIKNPQGMVCWDPAAEDGCSAWTAGVIVQQTSNGKTKFTLKPRPGRKPAQQEGFFEFDAKLP